MARAMECMLLQPLRRSVEHDERGRLVPQTEEPAAHGRRQHQDLDPDLALPHELLDALACPVERAERDRDPVESPFDGSAGEAEVRQSESDERDGPGPSALRSGG